MKHITVEYGQPTNLLELTSNQLAALEPFLNQLGIRVRTTRYFSGTCVIQAENPYRFWCPRDYRRNADMEMSPDGLRHYKY